MFDFDKIAFGAIPSPKDERDFNISMLTEPLSEFPEEFCLDIPPIQDQGQIGECVSEGLCYSREIIEKQQNGEYTKFSRGFTYGNRETTDHQGSGMQIREALKNQLKYGAVLHEDFPLEEEVPELYGKLEPLKEALLKKAYQYRISAYASLHTDDDIKTALIRLRCPVISCWAIFESFKQITPQNPIMPEYNMYKEKLRGYHCMSIIGWKKINGVEHWIVLNSWGDSWGDHGKMYAPFKIYQEEIWSTTDNVYPLKDYRVTRIAGHDRFETAVNISLRTNEISDNVVLCNAYNFPDALAGSVLNMPILLTGSDTLNKTTLQEIQRLKAKNVFILGGTGVISQGIEDELKKIYNVIRLADTNRHKTAFAIGEYAMKLRKADTAILTTGDNYPDALAIAPFSAKYGYPIVFNRVAEDSYHVHQEVLDYLKKWNIKNIIIVGGYNVVSEFIGVQLRKVGMNVVRLEGDNRYLTSLEIARYFAGIMQYNGVIVATGNNFVDALAGSSYAAKIGCPILLVDKDNVEEDIRGFVSRQSIKDVFVLGGDSVVSEMVIDKLREGK